MEYAIPGVGPKSVKQCRYDGSRLWLRGPRRDLEGAFVACLGGTETFGRFIDRPFPDLLEDYLQVTCVNFGWPNAGVDVFASDRALLDCVGRARLCVLQVPNALNLRNMYYRVHPRRNDRVLEATGALRALYPEVEFTGFHFTHHLLGYLRHVDPDRFNYVNKELSRVWVTGMERLIGAIRVPVVLLWVSSRRPDEGETCPTLNADPALVSREMLDHLRPLVEQIVEVQVPQEARGIDLNKAEEAGIPQRVAEAMPGPMAHDLVAKALHSHLNAQFRQ